MKYYFLFFKKYLKVLLVLWILSWFNTLSQTLLFLKDRDIPTDEINGIVFLDTAISSIFLLTICYFWVLFLPVIIRFFRKKPVNKGVATFIIVLWAIFSLIVSAIISLLTQKFITIGGIAIVIMSYIGYKMLIYNDLNTIFDINNCPACDSNVNKSAKYCNNCGEKLINEVS